jgi:hypothetical protein
MTMDFLTRWRMELRREAAKCEPLQSSDFKQRMRINYEHLGRVIEAREYFDWSA